MMRRLATVLVAVLTAACGQQEPLGLPDSTDPAARFFDPAKILEVAVEMAPADWDALRTQSRDVFEILVGDCMAEPFPSPFTFFPARVTVGGVVREKVAIRKKGFLGSLDEVKPSLRVKFDEYEEGRSLYGLDHLTLNNSRQDPSYVRQCLAYKVFADASVPAPRCSFAHVTVNGADLGLYVHVESVDKDMLARRFDDEDGNLYEGTVSDFRPEWVSTFARKTNEEDPDRSDLMEVVRALDPAVSDADLVGGLERVIDLDAFLDFWAAEVLLAHWDGYANNNNNFFVYREPGEERFRFIAWGADGAMSADPFQGTARPVSVYARAELARRLYLHAPTRARYFERLRGLLATAWDEGALLAELSRMETLITPVVVKATGRAGHRAAIAEVGAFITRRRGEILAELGRGEPAWNEGPRGLLCLKPLGVLEATFATTYGTVSAPNPFLTGTGRLSGTLDGVTLQSVAVGSMAGPDPAPAIPPRSLVVVLGLQPDGSVLAAFVVAETFRFSSAAEIPLDWGSAVGAVYRIKPGGAPVLVGYLMNGTLAFDQAGTGPGAAVSGRFRGQVIAF